MIHLRMMHQGRQFLFNCDWMAHVRVPWLWGKWVVVTVVGWWQDWCRLTGTGLI